MWEYICLYLVMIWTCPQWGNRLPPTVLGWETVYTGLPRILTIKAWGITSGISLDRLHWTFYLWKDSLHWSGLYEWMLESSIPIQVYVIANPIWSRSAVPVKEGWMIFEVSQTQIRLLPLMQAQSPLTQALRMTNATTQDLLLGSSPPYFIIQNRNR